jgi:translocation and assembly module TamB
VKALKIIGVALLTLLLIIVLLFSYLTMSHGGMQRLFSLGKSYVQGELQWSELQGSLVGPADIKGLQYTGDDGTSVQVDHIEFDWKPASLVRRQVVVEKLNVSGVVVRLPKPAESVKQESSEPFQLNDLSLPVSAEVKQLLLTDISVYPYGSEEPLVIDRIFFGGSGRESDLQVVELSANAPNASAKIDGMVNTTGNWPLSLTAVWQYDDATLGQLDGRARVDGNLDELVLSHQLSGAIESTAEFTVSDVTRELSLSGIATVTADNLGVLAPAAEAMPVNLEAEVSGRLNDLSIDSTINSQHPTTGPFIVDVDAHTDQKVVKLKQLDIQLQEATAVLGATGDIDLTTQQADLDVTWSNVNWPLLEEPALLSDASGRVKVVGGADGVTVTGEALVAQQQAGQLNLSVDVQADPTQVLINSLTLGGAGTDTSLDVAGVFSIDDNRVDLNGNWQNLRWPLTDDAGYEGDADYESEEGRFSVVGPLSDYDINLSLAAGGAKIPAGKWTIEGSGNERELSRLQVVGETLEGEIKAVGKAGWDPQPTWDFDISASGINPESQWPGFDAKVDVKIASSGVVTAEGLEQTTDIVDIGGTYKGQPLGGDGGISVVDGALVVDNLKLNAGSANITATGTVGSEVDLKWQIEAPSLEALVPGFKGELQISGNHSGSADAMDSAIVIDSAQVDSDLVTIADLDGAATVDLSGNKASDVELTASGIILNGQEWESLVINGNGKPQSHTIDLQLTGTHGKFNLQGEGGYVDNKWTGTVSDLSALATAAGDWELVQPVQVTAGQDEVRFRDLCLASDDSTLCAALSRVTDGSVDADVVLEELDVARFREFLPPDIGFDINVDGRVKVNVDSQGQLKVTADAGFPGGTLRYQESGEPVKRELGRSDFSATVDGNRIDAVADLDLTELGFFKLDASLSDFGADGSNATVNGRLDGEVNDLSISGVFVPALESVRGEFKSNLAFSGSIDAPRITGSAGIDNLSLEVPSVALEVTDGSLKVSGNGRGGLLLRGGARSGAGQLDLDGGYNATSGTLDLGVSGENFRVSNTSRQQVDISPDLNIRFSDRQLSVSGDLLVPTALIKTGGGGDTVIVESPDVVIIDSTKPPQEKQENDIILDVKVELGDNIRVDAGQFDGTLSGGITVNKLPGQVITGSGTIEVVSGDFIVYGQTLTMERGRVLFSGGPIDDPVLDLDVVREVPEYNVKAGVKVSGSAQTPILQLESDPPQTDANTLSFILLGKPVDALGASYTLGRYITPDIYVSYGFDLFDRRETFTLRYQLSKRLALIGTQSDTSGADLIYTLER